MSPIVLKDNKILLVDGKIAIDCACDCIEACSNCDDGTTPDEFEVTATGFTNLVDCDECVSYLNATHIVTKVGTVGTCVWEKTLDMCGLPNSTMTISIASGPRLRVRIDLDNSHLVTYQSDILSTPIDCANLNEATSYVSSSFNTYCNALALLSFQIVSL